jgi:hypothetical protein
MVVMSPFLLTYELLTYELLIYELLTYEINGNEVLEPSKFIITDTIHYLRPRSNC